jgi:hypothetical protein
LFFQQPYIRGIIYQISHKFSSILKEREMQLYSLYSCKCINSQELWKQVGSNHKYIENFTSRNFGQVLFFKTSYNRISHPPCP